MLYIQYLYNLYSNDSNDSVVAYYAFCNFICYQFDLFIYPVVYSRLLLS